MFDAIRRFLASPVFKDKDRTRSANLLNITLLTLLGITIVYTALAPLSHERPAATFVTSAVLVPLWLAGLYMIRRGCVRAAGIALATVLWVLFTAIAIAAGGVGSPSLLNYMTVILIAALVLGGRAGILFAAMSSAASLVMLGAELNGLLPPAILTSTRTSTWTVLSANFAVAAVLLHLATRSIHEARERASRDQLALAESEERFRSLFENAVMGLYRSTPDGRILMANPAMVRMLGYSSFEDLAKLDLERRGYAPGHSRAVFRQQIEAQGLVIGMELAWRRPDGRIVFIRENARAIRDDEGHTLYYEGTLEDITEQKRAVEALRENEQRYRALFERTSDAIFILDLEGRHVAVNQRAADLLGYAQDEMVGMLARQIIAPDEYSNSQARLAALRAGESLPIYERTFVRKDGARVSAEVNAALVHDPDGRPLHIQSVVRDISGRKRAEAERERLLTDLIHRSTQLVTAADVSKSASTILDPDELMVETVNLIQERFGLYYVGLFLVDDAGEYAVLRAATGQAGREMLAAGHKLAVGGASMIGLCVAQAELRIALDVGDEAVRFENPYLPRTRSELALPLASRGQCIGALTVQSVQEDAFLADDIAVLQSLADQLAIALSNARLYDEVQRYATQLEDLVADRTNELAAVNRELEAFAYSVSHDLRAPLRSVDGFGQAMLEDYGPKLDATGQDYLRRMRAASQRMGQLIDDLLKLSRLTRSELYRQPVNLSALAASITADLQASQPERQVEFVIAEGATVQGDERLLRIALENLLGNAWKFTGQQSRARIQFGVAESDGERAFFVRDDGAGFDLTYANKLFAPFQRLHGVTEFEGSGIGLATVQRIVHRHGGRVWATGAVGQGATFFFTLPARGGTP